MEKGELDNAFWRFAINFYEKPNMAELLLYWQDSYQLDVVMVLLMLYLDEQQLSITKAELQQLLEDTQNWRNRIETVRSLRRDLKTEDDSLYQQAKQFELKLERYYIAALYPISQQQKRQVATSAVIKPLANLELYLISHLAEEYDPRMLRPLCS